jgi:molybdenum cofactor cytidylyltransferase
MIAVLILAAGLGRRMGSIKPLLSIAGRPALERILATLDDAGIDSKIVVLGHASGQVQAQVDLSNCRVVINANPEAGLSSSLELGLEQLPEEATGLLVHPSDMPYIRAATVRAVCQAASDGAKLAAPFYQGERGFPVYFARSCLAELRSDLSGDEGGRRVLARHPDWLVHVEVDDPGTIHDLDRPSDVVSSSRKEASCSTSA